MIDTSFLLIRHNVFTITVETPLTQEAVRVNDYCSASFRTEFLIRAIALVTRTSVISGAWEFMERAVP